MTHTPLKDQGSALSQDEWLMLRTLHERYQHGRDLFSLREINRLRFLRCLHQMGRLNP